MEAMTKQEPRTAGLPWDLDEIPLSTVNTARAREREDLFYLVTAASFIESGAELYDRNLSVYFEGDHELVDWLNRQWRVQELRHGRSLRAYVGHVWPEFDWDRAYASFLDEYSQGCTVGALEPTRSQELAARCVVETGTATFYQALAAQAAEPVLAGIATRIRAEEVNHYKHFYRYFRQYVGREHPGRLRVLSTLGRRVQEARRGDSDCAFWHVYAARRPQEVANQDAFHALSHGLVQQVLRHFPEQMAVKMLLKPLDLPRGFEHALQKPLAKAITWALH